MYRDDEHLGDGYDNYVLVVLVHEGGLTCTQRDRTATADQGFMVTLLPRESYRSSELDGTDATAFYVPVAYLEGRGIAVEQLAAVAWEGGPLLPSIRELLDGTLDMLGDGPDRRSLHVEQALLELLAGLIGHHVNGYPDTDAAADEVRGRVFAAIAKNYADPSFDVSAIVAAAGVSRWYLYKLFEGREVSVASLLRSKRIGASEQFMRSQGSGATLSRIAREVGFLSGTSFSRAYKENRGISPGDYRDRHLAETAAATTP